jgi:hypothetical protein
VLTRAGVRRGPPVVLAAVLWLAALPAVAHAAPAPRVLATSHVPLVAAAGDRISLTATVRGTGKRVAIGLVLGSPQGSAKGGLSLGKGVSFAARGSRRLVVPGRVPAAVARGELRTLLVCVDPPAAITGKGSCRKAARIATSGTSTEERIAGAQQAGRLPKSRAILLGLEALRGDKRVPVELRGDLNGPGGEQAALKAAAASFGSLPRAVKAAVLPYFVPPPVPGSAWRTAGRNFRVTRGRKASAAAAKTDCTGFDSLQLGVGSKRTGEDSYPWQGVPTSDGKAIFWYGTVKDPRLKAGEATDRASAIHYASVFPAIWAKLTKEFGEPKSDAKEVCYHGPDGRLDIYVGEGLIVINARGHSAGKLAITAPYPASGRFCTNRPAFIMARAGLDPFALAHEFMHVLQFSHRYATCDEPISWWDEGGADWAGDFVYPDDNFEQRQSPELVADPLATNLVHLDYGAWPFWMMLQRTQGTGVLRSIFAQLQTQRSVAAVNAAIPGGYATQIPLFYLNVFNQSPVGDPDFAVPESFLKWDKWKQTPAVPAAATITLGSQPADTLKLPIQRKDGFPMLSVGAYHRVDIPDPKVREIKFTNDLAGKPGAHVDAMLHMADGTWKLADWSAAKTTTLCRDQADEDVKDLVIVTTNAGITPLSTFTHTLHVAANCPFPKRFDGTWRRTYTWESRGTWNEEITGTASYVRNAAFPPEADSISQVPYDLESGRVKWTVSGVQDAGTSCPTFFSGEGTDTPTVNNSGTPTDLGLENVTGKSGVPDPEPSPFYYSIRASVEPTTDPSYNVTNCDGTAPEGIVLPYLEIGHPGPFTSDVPQDQVQKSANPRLLEGHHVGFNEGGDIRIEDSWSFKGSD